MKIQFLGTAAAEGWPGLFCRCPACVEAMKRGGKNLRTRSQSLIDDGALLMDYCPDTYMHMLTYGFDLPNMKHCIITHTHEDHFYPDDTKMRCKWFANNVDEVPFTFWGNDALMARFDELRAAEQGSVYCEGIEWKELTEYQTAEINGYQVTPTIARHNPREKCFNYVISKDGKTLFYGHDSGPLPDSAWEYLEKCHFDLVTLDCTMLASTYSGGHMNITDCVNVRERMLACGCADEKTVFVINHFSHNGAFAPDGKMYLHEELVPYMAERGFLVSYDGMTVEF